MGELVNLMSVDTLQIQQSLIFMNALWTGPLQVAGAMILLYQIMGLSAFAGVAVMTLTIPINFLVFTRIATLQVKVVAPSVQLQFVCLFISFPLKELFRQLSN